MFKKSLGKLSSTTYKLKIKKTKFEKYGDEII